MSDLPPPGPEPIAPRYPIEEANILLTTLDALADTLGSAGSIVADRSDAMLTGWRGLGSEGFRDQITSGRSAIVTTVDDLDESRAQLVAEIAAADAAMAAFPGRHADWVTTRDAYAAAHVPEPANP